MKPEKNQRREVLNGTKQGSKLPWEVEKSVEKEKKGI